MTKGNYSSHIGGIEKAVLFYIKSVTFSWGAAGGFYRIMDDVYLFIFICTILGRKQKQS